MIKIGRSRIDRINGTSRLTADIIIGESSISLWFAVDSQQESYLCPGGADAFVMALLPMALREGHGILCEDILSERLRYQLTEYLIPVLSLEEDGQYYHMIDIAAPVKKKKDSDKKAVGASFDEEEDFLYTALCHGRESEYPLTHVLVFHTDTAEDEQSGRGFQEKCRKAAAFAEKNGLELVCVDTNLADVLPEREEEVSSFRKIACALALQGLLSVYLLPTGVGVGEFCLDIHKCKGFDMITTGCASTESLRVYLSGAELFKEEKLRIIKENKPSHHSIHTSAPASAPSGTYGKKQMIVIGKPYIEEVPEGKRLCASITVPGKETIMWFEVKAEDSGYFVADRADAFVAALLTMALREGMDIVCESPVTRRLLYQINQYLLPTMASNKKEFQFVKVHAVAADSDPDCQGAVGTGGTGGADCMFTIKRNMRETDDSSYRLSHLMIASNGAITGTDPSGIMRKMAEKAQKGLGAELNLKVISIDSNIQEILPENFLFVTTIRHAAVILALQKLFSVFLVSSTFVFKETLNREKQEGCYESYVSNYLTTNATAFYSSGSPYARIQKLKLLSDFPLAEKYLHPCIYALRKSNCGECGKCIRTEAALYALGKLEQFSQVFDVERFMNNRDWYFANVLLDEKNMFHREVIEELERKGVDLSKARAMADKMRRKNHKGIKNLLYKAIGTHKLRSKK